MPHSAVYVTYERNAGAITSDKEATPGTKNLRAMSSSALVACGEARRTSRVDRFEPGAHANACIDTSASYIKGVTDTLTEAEVTF